MLAGLLAVALVGAALQLAAGTLDTDAGTSQQRLMRTLVARDSSGNENHGVIQGAPVLGVPGHQGTAYSFGELGAWVQVQSNRTLNPGRRDFLFYAWVNFVEAPDQGETYDILRKGHSYTTSGEFKVEIIAGGRVRCSAKDASRRSANIIGSDLDVTDGQWHRIGCARTGSKWSVVVDDTVRSERTELGRVGNTLPLSIGSKYGREDLPQGRVDDVAIYIAPRRPASGSGREPAPRVRIDTITSRAPAGAWRLDEQPSTFD